MDQSILCLLFFTTVQKEVFDLGMILTLKKYHHQKSVQKVLFPLWVFTHQIIIS